MKENEAGKLYDRVGEKYLQNRARARNDYVETPAVMKLIGDVRGKRVLDLGCGFGGHSEKLIKKGAIVTGIDASEKMIGFARARCGDKGKFFVADFETVRFSPRSFDAIVASYSIIYSKNIKPLFAKFHKWLTVNGEMVFTLYHPIQYYKKVKGFDYSRSAKYWFRLNSYGITIFNYYLPLEKYFDAIRESGFEVVKFLEPCLGRRHKGWEEDHYRLPPCIVIKIKPRR